MEDVAAHSGVMGIFEVAVLSHAKVFLEDPGLLWAESAVDFVLGPDVELSLDAFAIGVHSGIKASQGMRHVAFYVIKRFAGDAGEEFVARELVGFDKGDDQLG